MQMPKQFLNNATTVSYGFLYFIIYQSSYIEATKSEQEIVSDPVPSKMPFLET